ncbi:MAG: hypothetical protein GY710_26520 [Desulfobacteraceae bacterium]|nr:hypothetical protein [Desulfobacteraceae bacterium]
MHEPWIDLSHANLELFYADKKQSNYLILPKDKHFLSQETIGLFKSMNFQPYGNGFLTQATAEDFALIKNIPGANSVLHSHCPVYKEYLHKVEIFPHEDGSVVICNYDIDAVIGSRESMEDAIADYSVPVTFIPNTNWALGEQRKTFCIPFNGWIRTTLENCSGEKTYEVVTGLKNNHKIIQMCPGKFSFQIQGTEYPSWNILNRFEEIIRPRGYKEFLIVKHGFDLERVAGRPVIIPGYENHEFFIHQNEIDGLDLKETTTGRNVTTTVNGKISHKALIQKAQSTINSLLIDNQKSFKDIVNTLPIINKPNHNNGLFINSCIMLDETDCISLTM